MSPSTSEHPAPTTVEGVLRRLTADPGRPRLTWYGPDSERVELSGHVLDNWVAKTANLLVEEFDAGPGVRILLDLPPHWRTVVWSLATWRVGACVVLAGPGGAGPADVDVVVTHRPVEHAGTRAEIVAVALPALARTFGAGLPAGAIDAGAAVMTYGDVLVWAPPGDASATALQLPSGHVVRHGELLAWALDDEAARSDAASPRVLVGTSAGPDGTLAGLRSTLAVLAQDGSVILCHPETTAALAADPARRTALVDTERVTA